MIWRHGYISFRSSRYEHMYIHMLVPKACHSDAWCDACICRRTMNCASCAMPSNICTRHACRRTRTCRSDSLCVSMYARSASSSDNRPFDVNNSTTFSADCLRSVNVDIAWLPSFAILYRQPFEHIITQYVEGGVLGCQRRACFQFAPVSLSTECMSSKSESMQHEDVAVRYDTLCYDN